MRTGHPNIRYFAPLSSDDLRRVSNSASVFDHFLTTILNCLMASSVMLRAGCAGCAVRRSLAAPGSRACLTLTAAVDEPHRPESGPGRRFRSHNPTAATRARMPRLRDHGHIIAGACEDVVPEPAPRLLSARICGRNMGPEALTHHIAAPPATVQPNLPDGSRTGEEPFLLAQTCPSLERAAQPQDLGSQRPAAASTSGIAPWPGAADAARSRAASSPNN